MMSFLTHSMAMIIALLFIVVRPILNYLKRVRKQIDAHDEMKENIEKLEKELEHIRMELKEQETKSKHKEDLLIGKDEHIKDLKDLINAKDKQLAEQLKAKNDLLKSKEEQIHEQLKAQNAKLTENNKEIKDLKDLINAKDKQFATELKAKIESKDELISVLKNAINEKNKQIDDLRTQIIKDSKVFEEKNQQLMKYNQQEENLANSGLYVDGVHRIQIAGQPPFEVSYISPLSGWTVIQRRMDGSEDFARDWEDYKKGFGDIRGEFFLGLERLHLMTQSKPHELYIQMRDVNGTTKYAKYNNFKVGGEKEKYKLISVGDYNGTAGDSLTHHVGYMFSTRDRDNDIYDGVNCAISFGGWWHRKCGYRFLNGKYYKYGISQRNGIAWGSWKKGDYKISLTFTQMMIRPTLQLN